MKNLIKKMSIFKSSKVKLSQFSDKLRKKIPWKRKNITSQRIQILFIKIRGGADLTSIKGRLRSSILFLTKKSRGGLIYIIL